MTTFFLTRPAPHESANAVPAGRLASIRFDEIDRAKAQRLAHAFAGRGLTAIQSSPRLRARQTARPIAGCTGIPIEITDALDEIDVGECTGRSFREIEADPLWQIWNAARSRRQPHGESIRELQDRVISHLDAVSSARPDAKVVLVSHAEVIRAVLLHALDLPLEDFWRIPVAPASVSTVVMRHGGMVVMRLNESPASMRTGAARWH